MSRERDLVTVPRMAIAQREGLLTLAETAGISSNGSLLHQARKGSRTVSLFETLPVFKVDEGSKSKT